MSRNNRQSEGDSDPNSATHEVAPPPVHLPHRPVEAVDRTVRWDAEGALIDDLPCRQCDYNLRGLRREAHCPECGLPLEKSIRIDLLRFSSPQWLRTITRGTLLFGIGVLLAPVFQVIATVILAQMMLTSRGPMGGLPANVLGVGAVFAAIGLAIALVPVAGAWLMTTPEPGRETSSVSPVNARTIARWCIMAKILAIPLVTIGGAGAGPMSFGIPTAPGMATGWIWVQLSGQALDMLSVIGYVALMVVLLRLARRIPSEALAIQTGIVLSGFAAAAGLLGFSSILQTIIGASGGGRFGMGPPSPFGFMGCGGCFTAMGYLAFGIWGIVLVWIYFAAFRRAAAAAEREWGQEPKVNPPG